MLGGNREVTMPAASYRAPIRDMSWMKHLFSGRVRERFNYSGYRVVTVELNPSSHSSYRFRMLFFYESEQKPVLSLNMETSILGTSCMTEHLADSHTNLGPAEPEMNYDLFKETALSYAEELVH